MSEIADTPAPPVQIEGEGPLHAVLETNYGELVVELFEAAAPRTVANFVGLATGTVTWKDSDYMRQTRPLYNNTLFHRVIPNFMIQGGDPDGNGRGGPGYRWRDEPSALALSHDRPGILSMANAGPDSNGSQFFITEVPTPHLDGRHAVFGVVIRGLELIKKLTAMPRNQDDRPLSPIKLKRVRVFRGALPSPA